MIISGLLNVIYGVLSVLLVFDLPKLPDTVTTLLGEFGGYVVTGVNMLSVFIGPTAMGVIALLLSLIIAMNVAYFLYSFVFWVVRKIPMLNVRE